MVIATQNPIEQAGTYPLPEAQLDRFLMRTSVGYPDADATEELLLNSAVRDRASLVDADHQPRRRHRDDPRRRRGARRPRDRALRPPARRGHPEVEHVQLGLSAAAAWP